MHTLPIKTRPSHRTIMLILQNEQTVINNIEGREADRKKKLTLQGFVVEEELSKWVLACWGKRIFLYDHLIWEKARKIQSALNQPLPILEQTFTHYSSGWLQRFKKRTDFRMYKCHGQEGDADNTAAFGKLPGLHSLAAQDEPRDVYDADELGLFYNSPSHTTIGPAPLSGRKKRRKESRFRFGQMWMLLTDYLRFPSGEPKTGVFWRA